MDITDLESNVTTSYDSIRQEAETLGCDMSSLKYNMNKTKVRVPYKGRYLINRIEESKKDSINNNIPRLCGW